MNTDICHLSIVTVCLNERDRIEQTAQSIVNQTFQNFEWIVIDGGSNDGTLEILEKYKERIHEFVSEKDNGIYHAMNKGILLARGEYCLFMNGGDMFHNVSVLERFVKYKSRADINYGGIVVLRENGVKNELFLKPINNYRDYFFNRSLPHQGSFIKRELFDRIGGYDTRFRIMADQEFFARAIIKARATVEHLSWIVAIYHFDGLSAKSKRGVALKNETKVYHNLHFGIKFRIIRFLNICLSRLIGRPT